MLMRSLAWLIVAVAMASGAVAGPLEDGFAAVQRGDYATALQLWTPGTMTPCQMALTPLTGLQLPALFATNTADARLADCYRR